MIIVYAQSEDRQDVVAAVDGELVTSDEANFVELRQKAVSLNFSTASHRVGDVDVRYGKGVVRLEICGADRGRAVLSPIVVVADAAELLDGRDRVTRRAIESIIAIGRNSDAQSIDAGLGIAERLHRSARMKRRVATAVVVSVFAVSVVLIARGCGGSAGLLSAANSWAR